MSRRVLLLTAWGFPAKVISWQRACTMIYEETVDVLATYPDVIRSPSTTWPFPAVVRLRRSTARGKTGVNFSRINVYTRDKFQCAFCGVRLPASQLSFDHLVPRSKGGKTVWTNVVTACKPCNGRKGDKTCAEAGMHPAKLPVRPKWLPLTPPYFGKDVPDEWKPYVALS